MASRSAAYDLVIFDMDGTLIDSETLAESVLVSVSSLLENPFDAREASELFRGRHIDYVLETITERNGGSLPPEFLPTLNERYIAAVATDLKVTEGAREVLDEVSAHAQVCVASNSEPDGIAYCLKSTGLIDYFSGHLFAGSEMAAPKPAPDIYLHASATLGVPPERTLVIEDSPLGVEGAQAGGFDVVAFSGNDPSQEPALRAFGVPVVDRFKDVLPYFWDGCDRR